MLNEPQITAENSPENYVLQKKYPAQRCYNRRTKGENNKTPNICCYAKIVQRNFVHHTYVSKV